MVEITIEAVRDRTWAAVETGCGTSAATMAQRRTAARVVYCDPVRARRCYSTKLTPGRSPPF